MRKLTKPYFITLEGVEGSGKSSQIDSIIKYLEGRGVEVLATREPGGTELADKIRRLLVEPHQEPLKPLAELLLYNAARLQHVTQVLRPALNAGRSVVCDRYTDATVAYQAYGRQLPLGQVTQVNEWATEGLHPDLTFLLDCPPALGLERSRARLQAESSQETRFETEELVFHERVRAGYLELAERQKERFVIIDASQTSDQVSTALLQTLEERLES